MDLGREHDFRVLAAVRGDIGLQMARQHRPDAITLDLDLPGLDGWNVLDRLKHDTSTRHIPVHVISVTDDPHRGMRLGAKTFWAKPSEQRVAQRGVRRDSRVQRSQDAHAADRRRRRRAAQHAGRADRRSRRRDHRGRHRPGSARSARAAAVRLHRARPRPARHERPAAARADALRQGDVAGAGDHLHRQGADQDRGSASCGSWRRPSSSRTSSRPSACSTRRRCSCTASKARCRPRSSGCSISCTAAIRP